MLLATEATTTADLVYAIDTVWIALCSALVLLMHLGFGMLEAGLTRSKNAANIVGKNMITVAIGAVAYWAVGSAFAYGNDAGGFIGTSGFFNPAGTSLGDGTQAVFQLVFAATAATIVSGAVAERINFYAYVVVAFALTAFIFPVISHWQWSGDGWLGDMGFYDFAGSGIVHLTGGAAALVGAAILGPRIGKYSKDGKPRAIPGHSIPLAIFGVIVLFFGWYGFNGGSTLAAVGQAETIGTILMNTTIAGGAGALMAAIVNTLTSGKPDPAMIGNGALAGLVGITAGPDLASNTDAFIVGVITGAVVVFAVSFFDRVRVDDPVGAVSVHGVCGALGVIFVGIYAPAEQGLSVITQLVGVLAIFSFSAITTGSIFLVIKKLGHLRVSERHELDGLDLHEHGVAGYPDLGPSAGFGASTMTY